VALATGPTDEEEEEEEEEESVPHIVRMI